MSAEDDEVKALGWIRRSEIAEAGCVTLAEGASTATVVRGFGHRATAVGTMTLRDVGALQRGDPLIAIRMLGSWVLTVEVNGWQGSRPETLSQISGGGRRAVSAFWNVNGVTRFSYARDGRVLTAFEAMSADKRDGSEPDTLESLRATLPWDDQADLVPVLLALAHRVTGQDLAEATLSGEFDVYELQPWAEAVRPQLSTETSALTYDDPVIAWALRHANDEACRRAARACAEQAIREAGLEYEPAVAAALSAVSVPGDGPLDELAARFEQAARRGKGRDRTPVTRFWAVTALREALGPDPLGAAFGAISAAISSAQSLGAEGTSVHDRVLHELGDPQPPSGSLGLVSVPGSAPSDRYSWIRSHWMAPAGQVLYARHPDKDELARLLDAQVTGTGVPTLTLEVAAAIRQDGDWALAISWHESAIPAPMLQRMAREAMFVSISWTGRRRCQLHYAANGTIIASLDPQRPQQRTGPEPGFFDQYLDNLVMPVPGETGSGHAPLLLTIAERITGISFMPEALDHPHSLARIPDPRRRR